MMDSNLQSAHNIWSQQILPIILKQQACSDPISNLLPRQAKSERKFQVFYHESKIDEGEEMKDEEQTDYNHEMMFVQLVKKELNYRLASLASNNTEVLSINRLHITKKVDQITIHKRAMMKICQHYYTLNCFNLSKLLHTTLIDQCIKQHIVQYVKEIEEDIKDKIKIKKMRQNRELKIYLQKTQCQTLSKCLREFRILPSKETSSSRLSQTKYNKPLCQQQSESMEQQQKTLE